MSVDAAKRIRREVLEPAMDSRAHNLEQARVLFRPETAEVDSLKELIDAERDRIPADLYERLDGFVWHLVASNGFEGECERQVAGSAESIAAGLYATAGRIPLRPGQLADMLRDPLAVIEQMQDPRRRNPSAREIAVATTAIRSIVQQVPTDTLLSRGLAHELRASKTAVLRQFVDAHAKGGRS